MLLWVLMNKREIGFLFVPYYIIDIFIKDLNREDSTKY